MFSNVRKMCLGVYIAFQKRRNSGRLISRALDREKLIYPFRLLFHPVAVFNDLKFEGKLSVRLANLLLFLFFLERALESALGGYLFNEKADGDFSIWPMLAGTVGISLLWTVCNWAMCTLTGGEGRMSEIWGAVCYSLTPWILLGFVGIALSNIFSLDESVILGAVHFLAAGWSLLLVFLGMMVIHQFSVTKTVTSVILTLLCMIAVCFLILLFFSIIQQIVGFVSVLFTEISFW